MASVLRNWASEGTNTEQNPRNYWPRPEDEFRDLETHIQGRMPDHVVSWQRICAHMDAAGVQAECTSAVRERLTGICRACVHTEDELSTEHNKDVIAEPYLVKCLWAGAEHTATKQFKMKQDELAFHRRLRDRSLVKEVADEGEQPEDDAALLMKLASLPTFRRAFGGARRSGPGSSSSGKPSLMDVIYRQIHFEGLRGVALQRFTEAVQQVNLGTWINDAADANMMLVEGFELWYSIATGGRGGKLENSQLELNVPSTILLGSDRTEVIETDHFNKTLKNTPVDDVGTILERIKAGHFGGPPPEDRLSSALPYFVVKRGQKDPSVRGSDCLLLFTLDDIEAFFRKLERSPERVVVQRFVSSQREGTQQQAVIVRCVWNRETNALTFSRISNKHTYHNTGGSVTPLCRFCVGGVHKDPEEAFRLCNIEYDLPEDSDESFHDIKTQFYRLCEFISSRARSRLGLLHHLAIDFIPHIGQPASLVQVNGAMFKPTPAQAERAARSRAVRLQVVQSTCHEHQNARCSNPTGPGKGVQVVDGLSPTDAKGGLFGFTPKAADVVNLEALNPALFSLPTEGGWNNVGRMRRRR